jgi:hypothetical protein
VDVAELLIEAYDRLPPLAHGAVDGVDLVRLTRPPAPGANPIAWLIWHLARVQDHHVSNLMSWEQVWVSGDWAANFGLDADPSNTGYGHTAEQVLAVRPERAEVLLGYLEAVNTRTRGMLRELAPSDLDRIVDTRWDPPVTMGVRLVSVADDSLQHLGQAAYVRGLVGA